MAEQTAYKTLKITQSSSNPAISYLFINRPSHRNALSTDFFTEFPDALYFLDHCSNTSVIILAGTGDHFCSGINISTLNSISQDLQSSDPGRASERLRRSIKHMQAAITALENCRKPVIASIHGACIGAAIDIVTACDIRYCSVDSFFSVKEVDLAIPADLGTLQRLPSLVGFGNAMELALTGRRFSGAEAKQLGLVSGLFESREKLEGGVRLIAEGIAAKSPLAVTGTKAVLLRSKELTVEQGLDYVATWNAGMLLSTDLNEAISAYTQKRKPVFSKL